jgi:predicted small lipoprotein YifL
MGSLTVILLLASMTGCGAVGSPIPPEDVGIEAKVRKQQRENVQSEAVLTEDEAATIEQESVELPTFYPIGTR